MTNLTSKDIILPTKVRLVKSYGFSSSHYGCESWAIKKAEHQRTDAFKLWCWERLMKIKPINPNIQEINPEYSLEGLMLKLKLQHFGT